VDSPPPPPFSHSLECPLTRFAAHPPLFRGVHGAYRPTDAATPPRFRLQTVHAHIPHAMPLNFTVQPKPDISPAQAAMLAQAKSTAAAAEARRADHTDGPDTADAAGPRKRTTKEVR